MREKVILGGVTVLASSGSHQAFLTWASRFSITLCLKSLHPRKLNSNSYQPTLCFSPCISSFVGQ